MPPCRHRIRLPRGAGVLLMLGALSLPAASTGASELRSPGAPSVSNDPSPKTSRPALEVDPLALSEEMRVFVDRRVGHRQPRLQRLLELQDAVFDPDSGLGITYGSSLTRTAIDTFRERSGNCLSFTLLFVALARHLGLTTHFVEVDEVTSWSQRGEVDLSQWHMYAEVELEGGVAPVDFLPGSQRRYRSRRRISEARARAHYFNNVGADSLARGEASAAVAYFERALELDPGFEPAKVNMAVAYRRFGDIGRAEELLLEVLRRDRRNAAAASNLAQLYLSTGQQDEARRWMRRRDALLDRNPFHHFRLGVRALEADRPAAARDHFRRAIRRQAEEGVFFQRLAESYLRLGKVKKARAKLERALELTEDRETSALIRQRLAELED